MKTFLLSLLILGATAEAVELHLATNRQILQELSRRLETGTGGGESAQMFYLCDNVGYLKMEVITAAGSKTDSKYLGGTAKCKDQVDLLVANKSKIHGLTIFALCDHVGYLNKMSVTERGDLKSLSNDYLGNYDSCLVQAKAINSKP